MRTLLLAVLSAAIVTAASAEPIRILYLHKSAGFQHSVVFRKNDEPCHSEKIMAEIADSIGAKLTSTKDASTINAENLKNYDLVVFYTTGDLTQEGTDKQPPMGPDGVKELLDWIHAGGGFMGFHCATDTFHRTDETPESPYLDMLGGEFLVHGAQFEGKVNIVDKAHPAIQGFPDGLELKEEWYLFKNLMTDTIHVIATLDPGAHRQRDERYNIPNYPIVWCSAPGKGRVFYNAMGHREDVWENEHFKRLTAQAIKWAAGEGDAHAVPNYAQTVQTDATK